AVATRRQYRDERAPSRPTRRDRRPAWWTVASRRGRARERDRVRGGVRQTVWTVQGASRRGWRRGDRVPARRADGPRDHRTRSAAPLAGRAQSRRARGADPTATGGGGRASQARRRG